MQNKTTVQLLPVLPLRDIILFPHMVVPLFVGRDKSVRALETVMGENKQILLVAQKEPEIEDPQPEDMFEIGTIGSIMQLLKLPDDTVKVLVEGQSRSRVLRFVEHEDYLLAECEITTAIDDDSKELRALMRTAVNQFEAYLKLNKKISPEVLVAIGQIKDARKLADTISSHLAISLEEKQTLLEMDSVQTQLDKICTLMESEIGVLNVEKKIRHRVKRQMEKTQREYYLNEQLKAIQRELGEGEDGKDELVELEEKIEDTKLTAEAREKCEAELRKLRNMNPMSAEATVCRNYLDWMLGIPWKKRTRIKRDIIDAEGILDKDHYGLEKVKERILEYLAVQQRSKKVQGAILCLVGPPGVGKTSLGSSIAKATGRNFVRMSLGGVRDEAEVRGHRRTYIGSMPGKFIQSMKKAKSTNPLLLLDEIDKLGADWRGDPSSALLEVLDPEQNHTFSDHYLEVDYDLSDVMFVCTANSLNMPQPLLDRMEIIRVSGYTEDEKVEIAQRHLLPKQVKVNGLKDGEWSITEEALRDVIRYYTREAGVRNLERTLGAIQRKCLRKILKEDAVTQIEVTPEDLAEFAGVRKYRYGVAEETDLIGMVTGLAYTETGGDILTIESVTVPGKGRVISTGKLGDVMKESITAAESLVKSRAPSLGISRDDIMKRDIHVHVPEGATPKDGPSAGVGMVTSIVSLLTNIPVRRDVAMTGEITLRGHVLAIGGLKEKLLAALRGGIKTVLIPKENEKDLVEIPDNVKEGMDIIPVSTADEVLQIALTRPLTPVEWEDEPISNVALEDDDDEGRIITH